MPTRISRDYSILVESAIVGRHSGILTYFSRNVLTKMEVNIKTVGHKTKANYCYMTNQLYMCRRSGIIRPSLSHQCVVAVALKEYSNTLTLTQASEQYSPNIMGRHQAQPTHNYSSHKLCLGGIYYHTLLLMSNTPKLLIVASVRTEAPRCLISDSTSGVCRPQYIT